MFVSKAPTNPEFRDWSLPGTTNEINNNQVVGETNSNVNNAENDDVDLDPTEDKQRFIAEVLYIMRPLCHCKFGSFNSIKIKISNVNRTFL
jgi:hypothetical protein